MFQTPFSQNLDSSEDFIIWEVFQVIRNPSSLLSPLQSKWKSMPSSNCPWDYQTFKKIIVSHILYFCIIQLLYIIHPIKLGMEAKPSILFKKVSVTKLVSIQMCQIAPPDFLAPICPHLQCTWALKYGRKNSLCVFKLCKSHFLGCTECQKRNKEEHLYKHESAQTV